jgi:hypothetical protein
MAGGTVVNLGKVVILRAVVLEMEVMAAKPGPLPRNR